jgi:hypothetical protein
MLKLVKVGGLILFIVCIPLIAAAQNEPPSIPPGYETNLRWWALLAIWLFAVLGSAGMFALYYLTYPSVDDFQRFVYNSDGTARPSAARPVTQDNPLLRSNTGMIYETVQHIVETQNTSWNMYLQYTVAIVIVLFLVCLIILGIGAQPIFPIIATIVGAVIGNAIQPSRARAPQQNRGPAQPPVGGQAANRQAQEAEELPPPSPRQ